MALNISLKNMKEKMKTIKILATTILIIIIIIAIAGIIKFNFINDDIYIRNGDGTIEKYDEAKHGNGSYHSKVMLKLFNIKTPNDFIIHIPESEMTCKLNEFIMIDSTEMIKGNYTDGVEKGIVVLDNLKITTLNINESKDKNYFIAPFFVSNQGTGVFYYLGLFALDTKEMTVNHIDSYLLGDRIKILSLNSDGNKVHTKFKKHSIKQAMAEEPNEEKDIVIKVTAKGFSKN